MAAKVEVEITRTCLSLLMRDNALSDGDQEGFLFGEITRIKGRNISDHDVGEITETTMIRITSHMCMPQACTFYNGVGLIDQDKIAKILGPFRQRLVGYFDFKRESPPELSTRASFRMTTMFRELNKWYIENVPTDEDTFNPLSLMMLRQYHSDNKAILNNTYCFYVNKGRAMEKIGSKIPNLGDTSNRPYINEPPVKGVDEILKKELGSRIPTTIPEQMPVVKTHNAMLKELKKAGEAVDLAESKYREVSDRLRKLQEHKQQLKQLIIGIQQAKSTGNHDELKQLISQVPPMSTLPKHAKVKKSNSNPQGVPKNTKIRIKEEVNTQGDNVTRRSKSPGHATVKSKQERADSPENSENTEVPTSPVLTGKRSVRNRSRRN